MAIASGGATVFRTRCSSSRACGRLAPLSDVGCKAHTSPRVRETSSVTRRSNGRASSGFSDLIVSIKYELPAPLGFHLSATGGLGFPTGASKVSSRGYDPYIQFPWSRRIGDEWSLHGMFTVTWFTSHHALNPTFEPTLSLERDLGPTRDLFVEYVGDYPNHARPAQILAPGG